MIEDFFELEIIKQVVVAPSHPSYFDGRFRLFIRAGKGTVEIREKGYTLDSEAIKSIREFVLNNEKTIKKYSKMKEKPFEGGKSISFLCILNNKIYSITNYINMDKFKVFEKEILDKIDILIKQCIANGSIYNDESSPNPLKEAEEWKSGFDISREKELERKINFLKSKIEYRQNLLEKLKNSQINDDLFDECFAEVVVDTRLYIHYENYAIKTPANPNPKKSQELSLDEIARQFVFFRRRHYFTGGYGGVIDDEEREIFIELMERYCSLKDEEAKKKLRMLEANISAMRKTRELYNKD